jgi:hypothetical protein
MRTTIAICCAALALLPACSCDAPPPNALESCTALQIPPLSVRTDILFVVDDSGSMSEEQANLAANLGAFIDTLAASPVENDFRIGVTNTAVTDFNTLPALSGGNVYGSGPMSGKPYPSGAILAVNQVLSGGNSVGVPGSYVYDTNSYAATNGWGGHRFLDRGDATLQQDFKANVLVGTWGSGREQPFRAAQLALTDRIADGTNAGFLRSGAKLAVIILSDEDDCSPTQPPANVTTTNNWCHAMATKNAVPALLETPDDFAAFLSGTIAGEPRDATVGIIAGFDPNDLTQPSCSDAALCSNQACSTAYDKGDRFKALYDSYGVARARLGSICDASFENTLVMFAQALMPTSMPLSGEPADWRMLAVKVTRSSGQVIACKVALAGTTQVGTADAVYHPPAGGQPPELTFTNACVLQLGDRIDVQVICAG